MTAPRWRQWWLLSSLSHQEDRLVVRRGSGLVWNLPLSLLVWPAFRDHLE